MRTKSTFVVVMVVVSTLGRICHGTPVEWSAANGGNGHCYEYFSGNFSWYDAKTNAASLTFLDEPGFLATVTSPEENEFLFTTFGKHGWLGGSDVEEEGVWKWMTGPEEGTIFWLGGIDGSSPTYANWATGEPNNKANGFEDHLVFSWESEPSHWNDLDGRTNDNPYHRGYYVEYQTPEPATLLLLGLGGIFLRTRGKA